MNIIIMKGRRYDYFTMFKKYFGDKFSKFIDDELENMELMKGFSAMNVVNSIFPKFPKINYCQLLTD